MLPLFSNGPFDLAACACAKAPAYASANCLACILLSLERAEICDIALEWNGVSVKKVTVAVMEEVETSLFDKSAQRNKFCNNVSKV